MKFKIALAACLSLGMISTVYADEMGPNGDKFYEEAARFETACNADDCASPYSRKVLYSLTPAITSSSDSTTKRLETVAVDQAQIWGDTILEGDYHAAGNTRLDEVVAYYKDGLAIGYKIQYSEQAWYTGDCDFNGKNQDLKSCQEGRIVEGSYVSADTLTYFTDEERYAAFAQSN